MPAPEELQATLYAAARFGGASAHSGLAVALRAILDRVFVTSEPPTAVRKRANERAHLRSDPGTREADRVPTPKVDFGYSSKRRALWILRSALEDFSKMPDKWSRDTRANMFDEGHALSDSLVTFAKDEKQGLTAWRDGTLSLGALNNEYDKTFFESILSIESIRERGMPTIRTDEGIVWIGLSSDSSALNESVVRIAHVEFVSNTDTARLDALFGPINCLVAHPNLRHAERLCISGRMGTGKTSAVRLLAARARRVAVIGKKFNIVDTPTLAQVLAQHEETLLVIEDLDERSEKVPFDEDVNVVVTYRTENEGYVREQYPIVFHGRDWEHIDLDALTTTTRVAFFERVIRSAADASDVTTTATGTRELANRVAAWDARASTLVRVVQSAQGRALPAEFKPALMRNAYWAKAYRQLRGMPAERAIAELVAIAHHLQIRPVPVSLLRSLFEISGLPVQDFLLALDELAIRRWLHVDDDCVVAEYDRSLPETIGLWKSPADSRILHEFAECVLQHRQRLGGWWKKLAQKLYYAYLLADGRMAAEFAHHWSKASDDQSAASHFAFVWTAAPDDPRLGEHEQAIRTLLLAFRGNEEALQKVDSCEFAEIVSIPEGYAMYLVTRHETASDPPA